MPLFAFLFAMIMASPALAGAPPHSGLVERTGFKPSDVALFVCAAFGIWFVRRALRARFRRRD